MVNPDRRSTSLSPKHTPAAAKRFATFRIFQEDVIPRLGPDFVSDASLAIRLDAMGKHDFVLTGLLRLGNPECAKCNRDRVLETHATEGQSQALEANLRSLRAGCMFVYRTIIPGRTISHRPRCGPSYRRKRFDDKDFLMFGQGRARPANPRGGEGERFGRTLSTGKTFFLPKTMSPPPR